MNAPTTAAILARPARNLLLSAERDEARAAFQRVDVSLREVFALPA